MFIKFFFRTVYLSLPPFEESELELISKFKNDPNSITTVVNYITEEESYIWGSDEESNAYTDEDYTEDKEVYTNCPSCSKGIGNFNDAGNEFCTVFRPTVIT